jgi:hypothetical protein
MDLCTGHEEISNIDCTVFLKNLYTGRKIVIVVLSLIFSFANKRKILHVLPPPCLIIIQIFIFD